MHLLLVFLHVWLPLIAGMFYNTLPFKFQRLKGFIV